MNDNMYRNDTQNNIRPHNLGEMSKRTYIAFMGLLVTIGFAIVAVGGIFMADPIVSSMLPETSSLGIAIVSLIVCIGGLVVQYQGAKRNDSKICLIGYAMISVTLGLITAWTLQYYDIGTITAAFIGMVIIAVCFGVLGYLMPDFFSKIHGMLVIALIAMIVVEIVLLFLGISQGVTDWIVLLIFCGFIGYDFYQAMQVSYTKTNAIIWATSIYLDLLNVFIRLLSIFGRRD